MYFDELDLNDDILDALYDMRFEECTPIQEKAIPEILKGRDLLATAQTGTGKTAAYLLPIIELLGRGACSSNHVNAIILVPTRELAQQVDQLLAGFAYYTNVSWIAIYGGNNGVAFAQQQKALATGGDIAIATPGRLLSLLKTSKIDLSHLNFLVLDEADRMLDIGFYDDIIAINSMLPQKKQTLMFSATFPKNVESLALKLLHSPSKIKISPSKPAEGIAQKAVFIHQEKKMEYVQELFANKKRNKGIVFLASKDNVKQLYKLMVRRHTKVAQIHSDLTNEERSRVLLDFKNNKIPILLATDVVARGIDIDDIDIVVNYDVPRQAEDYVHRVGRTARAGASGEAITLVNDKDKRYFDKIYKFVNQTIELLNSFEATFPRMHESPSRSKRKKQHRRKLQNVEKK